MLGPYAFNRSASDLQSASRTALMQENAAFLRALGKGGRCHGWLGATIRGRPHPADPRRCASRHASLYLRRCQNLAVEPQLASGFPPRFPEIHVCCLVGAVKNPSASESEVTANLRSKLFPPFETELRQRQFVKIPVLLPNPAPIPAGLLAADDPLLDQSD